MTQLTGENHAAPFLEPLLTALAQYGHPVHELDQPFTSPIALARRRGIPEAHLTGALQIINYPIAEHALPEPNTPNLYVGEYNGTRVYASDDPFDQDAQDFARGLVAFRAQVAATLPPALTSPSTADTGSTRTARTIMDALNILGYGDIQTNELNEPNRHRILLQDNRITHEELARAYAHLVGKTYIDPKRNPPHADVRNLLSTSIIDKYRIIPYSRTGTTLTVLQADPTDSFARVAVEDETQGYDIEVAVASEPDIEQLILTLYRRAAQDELLLQEAAGRTQAHDDTRHVADPNSPVTQRIQLALEEAVVNGASDIHWQTEHGGVMIRERLFGNLISRGLVPSALGPQMLNQLKMMSGMVIEARVPQDRRISLPMTIQGRVQPVRLRVSSIPANHGDSIVMRLLQDVGTLPALGASGFGAHNLAIVRDALGSSNGMVLVTGPTGSGKTTLMHTILKEANDPATKIMTIEDPIEYEQPMMVQVEIRKSDDAEQNLSFARVLRSLLRQDPDIIFVGEIRDDETANVAIQAAQTGHLLLSTLHTNSAVGTISRLMDLNVPSYLIAESLRVVISQRLVGKPCPECSVEEPIPAEYALTPGSTMLRGTGLKDGQQCSLCQGIGDYRRIAIHEVLAVTPEVRAAIAGGNIQEIELAAQAAGLLSLMHDGLEKVAAHQANLNRVIKSAH